MANCDWGQPCTCRRCQDDANEVRTEICPACSFPNIVEIYVSLEIKDGRKGLRYTHRTKHEGKPKSLKCHKCKFIMKNVPFYSEVSESSCKNNLKKEKIINEATPCDCCGEKIGYDSSYNYCEIKLTEHKNKHLCDECLTNTIKEES